MNPPEFPYLEAVDLISEGLKPLGDEYVQILRRGCLTDRWVDRAPNKGKPALGFSVFGPDPFVVLNYLDNVPSMSMLTHELGHSMHSYFTWRNQPYIYTNYSIFVAEVASNFNQALVRAHLLHNNPDPAFQIAMIEEAMNTFVLYFFFMPILSQFELDIHQRVERGEGLAADGMNARLAELLAEGYGDSVTFNLEYEGSRWAQLPQLVYGNYYMYQYVTGLAGAYALADRVLSGVSGAADAYLSFLKAGNSQYPLDVLKQAGVDLASPKPIEKTFEVLAGLIDRLEQLTQKTA